MSSNKLVRGINANADIIMTVSSVVGLVCTVILAVRETPRALEIIDDANYDMMRMEERVRCNDITAPEADYEIKEIKKAAMLALIRNYIPAAIAMLTTTGCMVGSTVINRKRMGALSGLLNATNMAYNEYRNHVRQAIGEKKETDIYDTIRKEHLEEKPPIPETIYKTGKGDTLCHIEIVPGDPTTGIYFYSSPEAVHKAINDANAEGIESGYVSMEDLLDFLGLRVPGHGTDFYGWQICSRNDLIDIRETSHVHSSGQPVLDIGFYNYPYKNFASFG